MARMEPQEIGEWFERVTPALTLYARQWVDQGEAEDVVQEVFIRLMSQKKAPDDVRAWLFRSVRNGAISRVRSLVRRRTREEKAGSNHRPWFEPRPDLGLDIASVQTKLQELPDDVREAVILKIWAGMTFEQMAGVKGVSVPTAYRLYQRGLEQIRKKMEIPCKKNSMN